MCTLSLHVPLPICASNSLSPLGTLPHLQWPPGAGQACTIEEVNGARVWRQSKIRRRLVRCRAKLGRNFDLTLMRSPFLRIFASAVALLLPSGGTAAGQNTTLIAL